jgi:hypothetical protein
MNGVLVVQAYRVCPWEGDQCNVMPAADGMGCAWEGDSCDVDRGWGGGGTGSPGKCQFAGPCCVSVLSHFFWVEQVALLAALPSIMDVVRVHIGEFGVVKACLSFFSNLSVNEETLLPLMATLPSIQAIGVR